MKKSILVSLGAIVLFVCSSLAYGPTGHEIVGGIADKLLANTPTAARVNALIDGMTLDGGHQMWTQKRWHDFVPRLKKWMSLWEETGRRHGLKADVRRHFGAVAEGLRPTSPSRSRA